MVCIPVAFVMSRAMYNGFCSIVFGVYPVSMHSFGAIFCIKIAFVLLKITRVSHVYSLMFFGSGSFVRYVILAFGV